MNLQVMALTILRDQGNWSTIRSAQIQRLYQLSCFGLCIPGALFVAMLSDLLRNSYSQNDLIYYNLK